MCEKEIAFQVTKSIKTNVIKGDRGNIGMLQWYIYINGIKSTVHNIANYGLFPFPSDQMTSRASTMTIASNHTNKHGTDATDKFRKIFNYLSRSSSLALQDNTGRALNSALFPSAGQTVSLWIPFSLHYMFLLHTNAASMTQNPIFKQGNYIGAKETLTKHNLMDNNWLTNVEDERHKIDNILDLAIIDSGTTLLNKQHIAYILFQFKEQRNKETEDVQKIVAKTKTWLSNAGDAKVFHIDTMVTSRTKEKRATTPKKTKVQLDMNTYIHKDTIITPLSNIGSNLLRLKDCLVQHQESLPRKFSHIPQIVDNLCQDLQEITTNPPIGPFTSIKTFIETHPATETSDPEPNESNNQTSSDDSTSDSGSDSDSDDD